eukprot:GHVN01022049.1.p1 GENE.GHVN01022049.1~~GHVN01022049.1.p1  ORF type:complete len:126 (+),score=59.58 GHVN01022049.1:19-396(+)
MRMKCLLFLHKKTHHLSLTSPVPHSRTSPSPLSLITFTSLVHLLHFASTSPPPHSFTYLTMSHLSSFVSKIRLTSPAASLSRTAWLYSHHLTYLLSLHPSHSPPLTHSPIHLPSPHSPSVASSHS